MKHKNADKLLASLEQKQKKGELITKADLVPLILSPLMSGNSSQKDRINKAFYITHKAEYVTRDDKDKIEAMLYAMADKFLDTVDLEKLKVEISMTRLGQMIWEDGIAEGEARGKVTGKTEGRISAYLEMLRDGFITEAEVAHRLNMTQEELDILLNKVPV